MASEPQIRPVSLDESSTYETFNPSARGALQSFFQNLFNIGLGQQLFLTSSKHPLLPNLLFAKISRFP
jgi:hypothetical protein